MMSAEKRYEYQESYKRYGVDMKPQQVRIKREKAKALISAQDKFRLLVLTIFLGILCVGIIITTAYAAQLQYDINTILSENTELEGEIQNLNVTLKRETNITAIEEKAMNELGMVYPYANQVVYLGEEKPVTSDFAMLLKDQAYN